MDTLYWWIGMIIFWTGGISFSLLLVAILVCQCLNIVYRRMKVSVAFADFLIKRKYVKERK